MQTAQPSRSRASATRTANPPTPDRLSFALSGRSVRIDPKRDAARRDIADIDLAGRWFAPRYAVPEPRACGVVPADIRGASSSSAPRISQLLPGERFCVVELSGDLAWGYSAHDHYVGYVDVAALTGAAEPTHVVHVPSALLFRDPDIRGGLVVTLPVGARLAGEREGEFLRTADGYVHHRHLRPVAQPIADPVEFAETLVGLPYLWGGRGAGGIDCSGLVQLAYGLAGIPLPRDSDQQIAAGEEIADIRRGDLLFWNDHVVMVRDEATVIHATSFLMCVGIEPLADLIARAGPPVARRRVT